MIVLSLSSTLGARPPRRSVQHDIGHTEPGDFGNRAPVLYSVANMIRSRCPLHRSRGGASRIAWISPLERRQPYRREDGA
jgi:hypothetical protein